MHTSKSNWNHHLMAWEAVIGWSFLYWTICWNLSENWKSCGLMIESLCQRGRTFENRKDLEWQNQFGMNDVCHQRKYFNIIHCQWCVSNKMIQCMLVTIVCSHFHHVIKICILCSVLISLHSKLEPPTATNEHQFYDDKRNDWCKIGQVNPNCHKMCIWSLFGFEFGP